MRERESTIDRDRGNQRNAETSIGRLMQTETDRGMHDAYRGRQMQTQREREKDRETELKGKV